MLFHNIPDDTLFRGSIRFIFCLDLRLHFDYSFSLEIKSFTMLDFTNAFSLINIPFEATSFVISIVSPYKHLKLGKHIINIIKQCVNSLYHSCFPIHKTIVYDFLVRIVQVE